MFPFPPLDKYTEVTTLLCTWSLSGKEAVPDEYEKLRQRGHGVPYRHIKVELSDIGH